MPSLTVVLTAVKVRTAHKKKDKDSIVLWPQAIGQGRVVRKAQDHAGSTSIRRVVSFVNLAAAGFAAGTQRGKA